MSEDVGVDVRIAIGVYSFEVGKGLNKTAEIIITIIINNIRRTGKKCSPGTYCVET